MCFVGLCRFGAGCDPTAEAPSRAGAEAASKAAPSAAGERGAARGGGKGDEALSGGAPQPQGYRTMMTAEQLKGARPQRD